MQDSQDDQVELTVDTKTTDIKATDIKSTDTKATTLNANKSAINVPKIEHSRDKQPDTTTQKNNQSQHVSSHGLFLWTSELLVNATQRVEGQWWLPPALQSSNTTANDIANERTAQAESSELTLSDSTRSQQPTIDLDNKLSVSSPRITTDTRNIKAGDIFLAIVGDNFDGHDFLETAQQKGAVAAIVSRIHPDSLLPQLKVTDTRLAFGQIAAYRRLQHPNLKVIAITGSSGKTTVKEMLRSIFKQVEQQTEKGEGVTEELTLVTRGNLNNDFGVPMMLLELKEQHHYAVLELGANHVGEIAYTTNLVTPDVACVLNIGTAHLGEFGGRDNIAKTKSEIYQALGASGIAVVPHDDEYANGLRDEALKHTAHILSFGFETATTSENAAGLPDVYATEVTSNALESRFMLHIAPTSASRKSAALPVCLPMPGMHSVSNALAAAACAHALGLSPEIIANGLSQVQSTKGRLARSSLGIHTVIDDTYNANPNSVFAAAEVLAAQAGEKILVLGDIAELGEAAEEEHYQLGQVLAEKAIDRLFCVGSYAKATVRGAHSKAPHRVLKQAEAFASKAQLLTTLQALLVDSNRQNVSCTFLFKGSRSARMETVIDDLTDSLLDKSH